MRHAIKLTTKDAAAIQSAFRGFNLESKNVSAKLARAAKLRAKAEAIEREASGDQSDAEQCRTNVVMAFVGERLTELGAPNALSMRIDDTVFSFDDGRTEEQFDAFLRSKDVTRKHDAKIAEDVGRELAEKSKKA